MSESTTTRSTRLRPTESTAISSRSRPWELTSGSRSSRSLSLWVVLIRVTPRPRVLLWEGRVSGQRVSGRRVCCRPPAWAGDRCRGDVRRGGCAGTVITGGAALPARVFVRAPRGRLPCRTPHRRAPPRGRAEGACSPRPPGPPCWWAAPPGPRTPRTAPAAARPSSRGTRACGPARARGCSERYDAVIAAHPTLAERLGPLRAEVVRHAEAFGGTAGKASPSAIAATGLAARRRPPPPCPATERDALAELAAAERALADRRAKALLDVPGELARLLASVAAAGAAHAYLLTEGAEVSGRREGAGAEGPAGGAGRRARRGVRLRGRRRPDRRGPARGGEGGVRRPPGPARRAGARGAGPGRHAAWPRRPAYALPFPVPDSAAAVRLAAELEDRVAGVYSDLVRAPRDGRRGTAAEALREAAVRAVRWRGESVAFPGLAERAATASAIARLTARACTRTGRERLAHGFRTAAASGQGAR